MEFTIRTTTSLGFFGATAALMYFSSDCAGFKSFAFSAFFWFLIIGPSRWLYFHKYLDWAIAVSAFIFGITGIMLAV